MTDLLLKRYHSLNYIFTIEPEEALSLIEYAFTQNEEELLFQRWINGFQGKMSFAEFKEELRPQKDKSETEILDDVKEILTLFER